MKNNFKENLNKKIVNDISNATVQGLQENLSKEARYGMENIYDTFKVLEQKNLSLSASRNKLNRENNFDYGLALNIFMQKFMMENKNEIDNMRMHYIEKQRAELGISKTQNPNYYIGNDNKYYSFNYDKFIRQDNIINIDENGNYTTREYVNGVEYSVIKLYSVENSIIYLYVVDKQGKTINNLIQAIRILDFKKEVVKKVKRIGYCGKSVDIWADFMNMFYTPIQTGYYSDNKYNFYKWDYRNYRFVKQTREGLTPGAPNIADYEQKDSKTIIRTDYDGAGLSLQLA